MKRIAYLTILAFLLVGCNFPTRAKPQPTVTADVIATEVSRQQTEIPTSTITPTAPPTVTATVPAPADPTSTVTVVAETATQAPGDPATALGNPSWKDSLDTTKNFYLYDNDNTAVEADNGSLKLTGKNANGWVGWSLTYSKKPTNFYIEGTFKTQTCNSNDLYGLVFRANKENAGYFFGITCDGRYNLYARDTNNDQNTEIRSMKAAPTIIQGSDQTNRIGVMAKGDQITLYVNGQMLEEVTDSTYSAGYFGAFISANATPGFSVNLDSIAMWEVQ